MISEGQVMGFVPTTDTGRARTFYEGVLGLRFLSQDSFALVVESGGTPIRVVQLDSFTPAPYTILGWQVGDLQAEVRTLTAKGVSPLRYPPLEQDDLGIWTAPGGTRIVWFADPDGNVLSLSQH